MGGVQRDIKPYPAAQYWLGVWIARRARGKPEYLQGRLKWESCLQALSAVKSVHTERLLSTEAFNTDFIRQTQHGIARTQTTAPKKKAAPISIKQLEEITLPTPKLTNLKAFQDVPLSAKEIDYLHLDTAFKVAFGGFFVQTSSPTKKKIYTTRSCLSIGTSSAGISTSRTTTSMRLYHSVLARQIIVSKVLKSSLLELTLPRVQLQHFAPYSR